KGVHAGAPNRRGRNDGAQRPRARTWRLLHTCAPQDAMKKPQTSARGTATARSRIARVTSEPRQRSAAQTPTRVNETPRNRSRKGHPSAMQGDTSPSSRLRPNARDSVGNQFAWTLAHETNRDLRAPGPLGMGGRGE